MGTSKSELVEVWQPGCVDAVLTQRDGGEKVIENVKQKYEATPGFSFSEPKPKNLTKPRTLDAGSHRKTYYKIDDAIVRF